jgi:ribonuclease D
VRGICRVDSLIKNGSMFELARKQPTSLQALSAIEDVTPKILRKEGESILAVIRAAKERAPETWPAPSAHAALPREVRDLVRGDLRKAASGVADSVGMPIEVLLRKKHIEALGAGSCGCG